MDQSYQEFRHLINSCGLIDLGYSSPYTWSNKRRAQFNIRERLDRALSNCNWRLEYPNASVLHIPMIKMIMHQFSLTWRSSKEEGGHGSELKQCDL